MQEGEEIAVNGLFKIDAAAQLAGKKSMMNAGSQSSGADKDHEHSMNDMKEVDNSKKHTSFMVYGNCGMCEERIEKAASQVKGVVSADWDVDTKMLQLEYDKRIVKVNEVEKAIAAVGHDTENERAPDEVYNDLPGCCLYDRPDK
ncbi:MAG: heavy metal-associated domain-containing protein [bacterium]